MPVTDVGFDALDREMEAENYEKSGYTMVKPE